MSAEEKRFDDALAPEIRHRRARFENDLETGGFGRMTGRVRLCGKDEVGSGEMLRLDIPGLPPLAVFNIDGEYYCTSNVCTHNFAVLTDGFFEADAVECPLHGGSFNVRTGAALEFPCKTPLKTYPVTAVNEDLHIDIE